MRAWAIFVAGIIVGSTIQIATAQQGRRLVGLNHVAIAVQNVDEIAKYYTNTLGLNGAFNLRNPDGTPAITYLQISRDTFLELQPAGANRPAGFMHFGLQVDN